MKITKLDQVFSEYVRALSGGYCKKCGKYFGEKRLQNAHFFGRIRHTVRWDTRNVVALCGECHYWLDVNPIAKTDFMLTVLSEEDVADLERIARMTTKQYPIDKEKLLEYYTKRLKEVE